MNLKLVFLALVSALLGYLLGLSLPTREVPPEVVAASTPDPVPVAPPLPEPTASLSALKVERDMWQKRYEKLLAQERKVGAKPPAAAVPPPPDLQRAAKVAALTGALHGETRDDGQSQMRYLKYTGTRPYRLYRAYRQEQVDTQGEGKDSDRDCTRLPISGYCRGTLAHCKRETTAEECQGTQIHCEKAPTADACRGTEAFCQVRQGHATCAGTGAWCLLTKAKPVCAGTREICEAEPDSEGCFGTKAFCGRNAEHGLCQADES